jgi:site-specific DNA-methyltransferase (cytosine-N4-specific)
MISPNSDFTVSISDIHQPFAGYRTYLGRYWNTTIEEWFNSRYGEEFKGEVNLILTSPPFPLNTKKSYGNRKGDEYVKWLEMLAPKFASLLSKTGSLVIEIGNAWDDGAPTMSTLPLESLLAIKKAGGFHLCQEFICHNPARLPSPVQYVNIERTRVKDSWTRIWWLSKTTTPKANNRKILLPYSKSMQQLLKTEKYNAGARPSQHVIGARSFLKNNGGAIPASCLTDEAIDYFGSLIISANTASNGDPYLEYCREHKITPHPARMQPGLVKFFISFLTSEDDLVLDPFAGSNTTGAMAQAMNRRWGAVEAEVHNLEPSKSRFEDRRITWSKDFFKKSKKAP